MRSYTQTCANCMMISIRTLKGKLLRTFLGAMAFASLLLANCAQVREVVRQTFNAAPGDAASYPDLWRLTLVNYNAGSGCLFEALSEVNRQRKILVWPNVRQALLDLEACEGAVEYVEHITRY
jgi:hypothetical protein